MISCPRYKVSNIKKYEQKLSGISKVTLKICCSTNKRASDVI